MKKFNNYRTIKILGILIASAAVLWMLAALWDNRSRTFDLSPWQGDYAGPRQYYYVDNAYAVSTTMKIDNIRYRFDDIGNSVQTEEGQWTKEDNHTGYQLESGLKLKNIWYLIDGNWYFFDTSGAMKKDCFLKVNDEKYYVDEKGKMLIGPFTVNGKQYLTDDGGAIKRTQYVYFSGNELYYADWYGILSKSNRIRTDRLGDPMVYVDNKAYIKAQPEICFYSEFNRIDDNSDNNQKNVSTKFLDDNSQVYEKKHDPDSDRVYVYEPRSNMFYSYFPEE